MVIGAFPESNFIFSLHQRTIFFHSPEPFAFLMIYDLLLCKRSLVRMIPHGARVVDRSPAEAWGSLRSVQKKP